MDVLPFESPASLANALASREAPGPLPARTVLVPSERHAHALRRALARAAPALLAGTRFAGVRNAAEEVLHAAGVPFTAGEDALRASRVRALLQEDLPLERLDLSLLRETPGWDAAVAHALAELEGAGLASGDLPRDEPLLRDLALLLDRATAAAGTSLGSARVFLEAAARLARDPSLWPFDGPSFALATGEETVALARFLSAVPGRTLLLAPAQEATPRLVARVRALHGDAAAAAVARPPAPPPPGAKERDLLAALLFAGPGVLADPARPRSAGPDGTVDLEEHDGVQAELEATATWVARQVLSGRPLEEIAVLVPAQDPLALLVAERLERLPFPPGEGPLPVHVAGGLPAVSEAGGARLLALLDALAGHLPAERVAALLPALRIEGDEERKHLTHGEAMELAWSLGTAGGNAANPAGALEWAARAEAREEELSKERARGVADEDSGAREAWRRERILRDLRAARPALEALVRLSGTLHGGEGQPLSAFVPALLAFVERFLLLPGASGRLGDRLGEALEGACAGPLGAHLRGADALDLVRERLLSLRVARGRFGEAAVHVGAIHALAGLDFAAVRIVGLCEGVVPSAPREDPVLPDRLREALERERPGLFLPRAEDRARAQVRALVAAVRGARETVALSAPRVDLARTEREPASLFVDAAAALGRPDAATGRPAGPVPSGAALARDAFRPAGQALADFRDAHPVSAACWLHRASRFREELPPAWLRDPLFAPDRLAALDRPEGPLGPADGVLGSGDPFPRIPGLSPERPISASALQQLLQCPRMFLMRRILGWDEPAGAPSLREVDAAAFGTLLHRAVETFFREHGELFVKKEGRLAAWLAKGEAIADAAFDGFLSEYPLVGERIREKERGRLRDALRAFLEYDFGLSHPERRLVGVEVPFGEETPLAIPAGGTTLHVRGYVDRIDAEPGRTVVRDLKSGRPYPRTGREAGPTPVRDVQIGLYQRAAGALASKWRASRTVEAAYAYSNGRGEVEERAFRGREEAAALAAATDGWLDAAAALLARRAFPSTCDRDDCTYCIFSPLCGDAAIARARDGLDLALEASLPRAPARGRRRAEPPGPLVRFRALKLGPGDGDGEDGA